MSLESIEVLLQGQNYSYVKTPESISVQVQWGIKDCCHSVQFFEHKSGKIRAMMRMPRCRVEKIQRPQELCSAVNKLFEGEGNLIYNPQEHMFHTECTFLPKDFFPKMREFTALCDVSATLCNHVGEGRKWSDETIDFLFMPTYEERHHPRYRTQEYIL